MRKQDGIAIGIAVVFFLLLAFLMGWIVWDHMKKWRECEALYHTPHEQYFCKRNKGVVR